METLIILLTLITVAVPALTEAAVVATHVPADGEWAREGAVNPQFVNNLKP